MEDDPGNDEAVKVHHDWVGVVFRHGAGGVGGEQRAGRLAQPEEGQCDVALCAAASG